MAWSPVSVPVSVCCRSSMVIMSPSSAVRLKLMMRVGWKVWCIVPSWVLAVMVNVGVMSTE